jgi:carbon starvation protein
MSLFTIALGSAALLLIAYYTYGTLLTKLLGLNRNRPTPAVELQDDQDFVPTETKFLLSQHFSAIAAAGPVVGPITAGLLFGWVPALIWILVGSILIGGVHDLTALVASIRHRATSIAEVVREHMSRQSYLLFLTFIWIALVYIMVAFTDVTASQFVGDADLAKDRPVSGAWIASSSMMYLVLPIIMGLLLKYTKLSLNMATLIFIPLIGLSIYLGQYLPLRMESLFESAANAAHPPEVAKVIAQANAQKTWDVLLLGYCLIAGVLPVWMLLQPRGHLGGYFLYIALAAGMIGLLFSGLPIQYDAFRGIDVTAPTLDKVPDPEAEVFSMFPMLMILIACGACSGFHSLIASGTTSKQLRYETDAKPVAYGSMLLEAMVAIISLSCVMILDNKSPFIVSSPNQIYANGLGTFVQVLGISKALAMSFALMAFSTFVFDTLDVCTRLGRYIIQELIGRKDQVGAWIGTILTAGVPILLIFQNTMNDKGKIVPVYKTFWTLFGASNQLLAALTLLGVTVWLWNTKRVWWVWLVTGLPCVWMYTMSSWALYLLTMPKFYNKDQFQMTGDPVAWAGVVLLVLAALMLFEAIRVLLSNINRGTPQPQLKPA